MKIFSLHVSIIVLLILTGCANQVMYRINPNSPPAMSEKEARDAAELSLSLSQRGPGIRSVAFEGDEFITSFHDTRRPDLKFGYSLVPMEIAKQGNQFVVSMKRYSSSVLDNVASIYYWKSEDDARAFIDAVYVLKNAQSTKQLATKSSSRNELDQALSLINIENSTINSGQFSGKIMKATAQEEFIEVDIVFPSVGGRTYQFYYDKIIADIKHIDNNYSIELTTTYATIYGNLFWKSEKDAQSFVQAVKSIQKELAAKYLKDTPVTFVKQDIPASGEIIKKDKPIIDVTDTSIKKVVTSAPADKKIIAEKPKVEIAQLKEKGTSVKLKKTVATKSTIMPAVEKDLPSITVTSPDISRAVSIIAKQTFITVTGIAESKTGIVDVQINGTQAELDAKGNFSIDLPIKVGNNEIKIIAIDMQKSQVTKQFVITREAGKVVTAKKQEQSPQMTSLKSAQYYALIIAIQDYDSSDINKLDYPVLDATKLINTLTSNYTFERENILFLQNPDRKTLYKALQNLRHKLTEKDNLLIFYAGHGYWLDDMKEGFWLPRDASGMNDPSDWIPNSSIRNYIKSFKVRHLLLIADACFSGGIFKMRDVHPQQAALSAEKIYELTSRKAITSGSLKTVPDRSVFCEYLVKRLIENKESYLDSQKLFARLRDAVINNSPVNQTPLYGAISEAGDEGGDFIFIKR